LLWLDISDNADPYGFPRMRAPRTLKYLDITHNQDFAKEGQLTEHCPDELIGFGTGNNGLEGLGELLLKRNFARLEMLKLHKVHFDGDEAKQFAEAIKKMGNIKYLLLHDCYGVDDEMISAVCESCPNIVSLDISNSNGRFVTKESLLQLAKLKKLKRLNANYLPIDDEVIERLAPNLKQLEFLSIRRSSITFNGGLWPLIMLFPKLVKLEVKSMLAFQGITIRDIERSIEVYSNLCDVEQWRKDREIHMYHDSERNSRLSELYARVRFRYETGCLDHGQSEIELYYRDSLAGLKYPKPLD